MLILDIKHIYIFFMCNLVLQIEDELCKFSDEMCKMSLFEFFLKKMFYNETS